jgi:translation initiation factor 2 alpha subunit (eIF-2alpha)
MRFYRENLPSDSDNVVVSFVDCDKDSSIIRVKLLEYDNKEANILYKNISKKLKVVNKFIKRNVRLPFVCSVYKSGDIPILAPVYDDGDCKATLDRYEFFSRIESIADDIAFQNDDITKDDVCEQFLWIISDAEDSLDSFEINDYLLDTKKLFEYASFPEDTIERLSKQLIERITYGDVTYVSELNLLVYSSHGIKHLNNMLGIIHSKEIGLNYVGAPIYRLSVTAPSLEDCKTSFDTLIKDLENYCKDSDVKADIEFKEDSAFIHDRIVRLKPLNKRN